ncbi:hypothetical protein C922_03751 [Plasmodium inui San Antonio 1]|uniref:Methyltransferase n=1 Tax=Plasmodium inui San Antonio 1 TaxID=1237626 RepID=W7A357_9APIC|nr:hypothetical protein C922_03751 [Plasmodium inui San Antonio 1]EUD65768.1 hypothetical protein C922_03751 [Plasmodium inui San Antonio 1]
MVQNRKIQKGFHRRGAEGAQRGGPNYGPSHRRRSGSSQHSDRDTKIMHERNLQNNSFTNFEELSKRHTFLNKFLRKNKSGKLFYNFGKSLAIYFLSKATLKEYYNLNFYLPYVQSKALDGILENITVISKGEDGDYVILQVNDLAQFRNTLLIMYNEYNQMLLNLPSENQECVLINESTFIEEETRDNNSYLCPNIPGRANYMHYIADLTALPKVPGEGASKGAWHGNHPVDHPGERTKERIDEPIVEPIVERVGKRTSERIGEVTVEELDKWAPRTRETKGEQKDTLLRGSQIKVLDIGVGSNCIYPLLGNCIYNWSFVGVDVNLDSLKFCYLNILLNNKENSVVLKYQKDPRKIFHNVVNNRDFFFFSICNPPFYSSLDEVNRNPFRNIRAHLNEVVYFDTEQVESTESQKVDDELASAREDKTTRREQIGADIDRPRVAKGDNLDSNYSFGESYNSEQEHFRGIEEVDESLQRSNIKSDLRSDIPNDRVGGEYGFILNMIKESSSYFYNVVWFTTLVSKFKNVKLIKKEIIKSMRLYTMDNKKQVNFLDSLTRNDMHFDQQLRLQKVEGGDSFPVHIAQHRIFVSYTGRISRWIVCWSYYGEEHIGRVKRLLHARICKT